MERQVTFTPIINLRNRDYIGKTDILTANACEVKQFRLSEFRLVATVGLTVTPFLLPNAATVFLCFSTSEILLAQPS